MTLRRIAIMAGILGMAFFSSCQRMPAIICYSNINPEMWDSRDTVRFDIPASESGIRDTANVSIRVTNTFHYSRMCLLVSLKDSVGATLQRDTVCLDIADNKGKLIKTGMPFIECTHHTSKPLELKAGMAHTIEITHIMKDMQVDGIYAVGIEIE